MLKNTQPQERPKNPRKGIELNDKFWIWAFWIFYVSLMLGTFILFAKISILHPY